MAEAPKGKAPPIATGKPKGERTANPMLAVIGLALLLGGAAWMAYSIATTKPVVKKKGGGH